MTKFVTAAILTAFTVVFTASAMAEGWRIGNWEPPKNEVSPVLKDVSLGTFQLPVAPAQIARPVVVSVQANCVGAASCVGVVAVLPACAIQPARACAGRSGGWFFGRRIQANRRARAQARMGCN